MLSHRAIWPRITLRLCDQIPFAHAGFLTEFPQDAGAPRPMLQAQLFSWRRQPAILHTAILWLRMTAG